MARNTIDSHNRIKRDERREINKVRARKMAVALGIACIVFIMAMMVEIYL